MKSRKNEEGLYFPLHLRLDPISILDTFSIIIFLARSGNWDDKVKMMVAESSAHEFTEDEDATQWVPGMCCYPQD